jgi:hypothetical protein
MNQAKGNAEKDDGATRWKPTVGMWLAVLALTIATALYFKQKTPDSPLDTPSLVLVAFCWFLLAFGSRWIWRLYKRRRSTE